jgi:biotin carboxylase
VLEYILGEGIPNGMSFPFIVKPSVSSASRGVSLVRTENEFYVAIESASKYVKEGEAILLEEYIRGEQFSIETISFNGKHIVLALVKEIISEAPFFMERIDIIDAGLNMGLKNQIVEFSSNLLSILNIQYGPCHIEVKIEGSQIRLIEIASRSGLLRDRLINTALGMNYNKLIIDSYNGNDVAGIDNFLPKTNALMGIILYPQDQEVFEELKLAGNISDYHLNGNSFSETPTMLTDAVGYFFTRNDIVDDLYNIQLRL